ncbi:hypothetical protein [Flavobacterium ustbae]|uniref:hypothetical protein n=1 Tax=Flavobacterium ustbae TaxID=2488790 RepID=UPI000F76E201|nr:hypothetical protein [Flavobacterium ustbae]
MKPSKLSHNITSLYNRHADEPDFDCEFLSGDSINARGNESILDPDPDEEFADDYNDRDWDTDIYDPYLEQSYY